MIRDPGALSEDGFVLAIVTINKRTGKVERPPEVVTRGFAAGETSLRGCWRRRSNEHWKIRREEKADYGVMKEKIRIDLKRYIQKRPAAGRMIMPVILEI